MLLATGGIYGGFTLFVQDNRLHYEYNAYNEDRFRASSGPLPTGEVTLRAEYEAGENLTGKVTLFVNDEEAGQVTLDRVMPGTYSISETFDVGQDTGSPVSRSYTRDNEFTGDLDRVIVQLED